VNQGKNAACDHELNERPDAMPDEILMAVATALAAKAADAAAGAAHEAWTRLVRLVRDRLGGDAQGAAALEAARARPGDRVAVRELAGALERAASSAPASRPATTARC
jgi:hypothetical protein